MTSTTSKITPTGVLITDAVDGPAWHEARSGGIGSSDAAAVLGMSPYKDRLGLWLEKTGQVDGDAPSRVKNWGHHLEDGIARGFAAENGWAFGAGDRHVGIAPGVIAHEEYGFIRSSLDRVLVEQDTIVGALECKNVDGSKAREWDCDEGVCPPLYWVQTQHQLLTTGLDHVWLAALIAGNRPQYLRIERDEVFLAELLEREIEFWGLVQRLEEPWGEPSALDYDVLARVRRQGGKSTVLVGADAAEAKTLRVRLDSIAAEKAALQKQVKALEAEEKAEKARVLQLLGDGEILEVEGQRLFTYKLVEKAAQGPTSYRTMLRPKLTQPVETVAFEAQQ